MFDTLQQRELNVLQRASLSHCRMIGSSSTPFPLPSVSSTGDTQEDWERETTCWRDEGELGWARSRIIRLRESLLLYKSFNILCPTGVPRQISKELQTRGVRGCGVRVLEYNTAPMTRRRHLDSGLRNNKYKMSPLKRESGFHKDGMHHISAAARWGGEGRGKRG
jgi:hypothetical protein